ncbi:MAG: patatin-like phospholipase family protein [Oscillospiraceae bacterium]|nr:patatin-like phospholipase family protein [Oscillospiraceae bacterium]
MEEMYDIGLVFGGGGAKGAYQIGVWNTFKIYGLDKYVKAVSGTSVGVLNAVLFALGDYDKAYQIWKTITISDMLYLKDPFDTLNNVFSSDGIFSRDGLNKFIDSLDLEKLKYSNIDVYASYKKIDDPKIFEYIFNMLFPMSSKLAKDTVERLRRFCTKDVDYCKINDAPLEFIKDILLVSTAMPLIYKCICINQKKYSDAGTTDLGNVPIEPLYENGFKNICVIPLDNKFDINKIKTKRLSSKTINAYMEYKGCDFAIIKPSKSLGNLITGTLNFSEQHIAEELELGEVDAYRVLRNTWIKKYSYQ